LWCGSNDAQAQDYFIQRKIHGENRLLVTLDMQELVNFADVNGFELGLRNEVDIEVNFDKLYHMLSKLRARIPVSEKKTKLFLNAWNFFNDVSYTINRPILQISGRIYKYSKKEKFNIYDKIFWGNNLLEDEERYHPIFSKKEIYYIKHALGCALKEIEKEIAISLVPEIPEQDNVIKDSR
jgi:hypothetical protein